MARFAYFVQTFSFYLIGKHGPKKFYSRLVGFYGEKKIEAVGE